MRRKIREICVPIEIWEDKSLSWVEKAALVEMRYSEDLSPSKLSQILGLSEAETIEMLSSLENRGVVDCNSTEKVNGKRAKLFEDADCTAIIDKWNSVNPNLPKPRCFTPKMKRDLRNLLKNNKCGIDLIHEAIDKIPHSKFLNGDNSQNWRATLQWLLSDSKGCFQKILEGGYGIGYSPITKQEEYYQ